MAQRTENLSAELHEQGGAIAARPTGVPIPLEALAEHAKPVPALTGDISTEHVDSAAAQSPPERVRFSSPLSLRAEGADRATLGKVVNLSVQGLACTAHVDLNPGERVWARFRLGLADEPLDLLCEVIWKDAPKDGWPFYGLRFSGLTDGESSGVERVVRERTEGRAGEWPLPLAPRVSAASAPVETGSNPWVAGAAGMAAGIGLALLLSAIAARTAETTPAVTAPPPQDDTIATAPSEPRGNAGSDLVGPPEPPRREPPRPSAGDAGSSSEAPAPSASPAPQPEGVSSSEDATTTAAVRLVGDDRMVTVELVADAPVREHVAFWLARPKRLVIDAPGRSSGFRRTTIPLDHPLLRRLRIGQHPGKVRFVIETVGAVSREVNVRPQGNSLVVLLKRTYPKSKRTDTK